MLASIFSVRGWARPSAGSDRGALGVKDLKKGKTVRKSHREQRKRVTAWLLRESRGVG